MTKRRNSTNRQHLKITNQRISNIVQRLPLHQQLNESQATIIKLAPAWQLWQSRHMAVEPQNNFQSNIQPNAQLAHYQNGTLTITCRHTVSASQLRHQQTSLLKALHKAGFNQIEQLNICLNTGIERPTLEIDAGTKINVGTKIKVGTNAKPNDSKTTPPCTTLEQRGKASAATLQSLKNCQKSVLSERLSNSLNNLIKTLKELN